MKKTFKKFPQACDGCDGVYTHWDTVKRCSGSCMKSFGNTYCTKGRKHFRLLKRNLNELRPPNCPIRADHPIVYEE